MKSKIHNTGNQLADSSLQAFWVDLFHNYPDAAGDYLSSEASKNVKECLNIVVAELSRLVKRV